MSHIVEVDVHIKDLDALVRATTKLGMEMVKQDTYKWFGRHVGDYPMPKGFTKKEMGRCEYALKIKGNPKAYEVGVVRRKDGKPGYALLWDFWSGGFGLQAAIGDGAGKLVQRYAAEVAIKNARRQGFQVKEQIGRDGEIRLVCRR